MREHREPVPPKQTPQERIKELEEALANQKRLVGEVEAELARAEAHQAQTLELLVAAQKRGPELKAKVKQGIESLLADL